MSVLVIGVVLLGGVGQNAKQRKLDWCDGPRAGLADLDAAPHYFRAVLDHAHPNEPDDEYFVWPADAAALA